MAEIELTMADLGVSSEAEEATAETNEELDEEQQADEAAGEQSDEEQEEKPAEEPEAKPAEEKKPEEKPEEKPKPYEVPAELKAVFPEATTEKDVIEKTVSLNKQVTEFVALLREYPTVTEVLKDLKEGKESLAKIFRKHLELADDELPPDAVEDPAGYKAFVEKQIKREALIKAQIAEKERAEAQAKEDEAKRAKAQADMEAKAIAHREEFKKRKGYTDAQVEDILVRWEKMLGTIDANTLDRIEKAVNYEADIEAERKRAAEEAKKAKVEGKNEAIDEIKKKTKGNGLPAMSSGSATTKPSRLDMIRESLKPAPSVYDNL